MQLRNITRIFSFALVTILTIGCGRESGMKGSSRFITDDEDSYYSPLGSLNNGRKSDNTYIPNSIGSPIADEQLDQAFNGNGDELLQTLQALDALNTDPQQFSKELQDFFTMLAATQDARIMEGLGQLSQQISKELAALKGEMNKKKWDETLQKIVELLGKFLEFAMGIVSKFI